MLKEKINLKSRMEKCLVNFIIYPRLIYEHMEKKYIFYEGVLIGTHFHIGVVRYGKKNLKHSNSIIIFKNSSNRIIIPLRYCLKVPVQHLKSFVFLKQNL